MAYATLADLKQRLGSNASPPGLYEQITDRLNATTADDTVGQALIDEANATVNQKLAGRVTVPIDTTGQAELAEWLKHAVVVIAAWNGWAAHPTRTKSKETVQTAYNEVMKTLTAIAEGRESLPSSTATGSSATAFGHDQRFTEDGMKGLV